MTEEEFTDEGSLRNIVQLSDALPQAKAGSLYGCLLL